MEIAILKITVDRKDLSKITKTEILRTEEIDEETYFAPLVEMAMKNFK